MFFSSGEASVRGSRISCKEDGLTLYEPDKALNGDTAAFTKRFPIILKIIFPRFFTLVSSPFDSIGALRSMMPSLSDRTPRARRRGIL